MHEIIIIIKKKEINLLEKEKKKFTYIFISL